VYSNLLTKKIHVGGIFYDLANVFDCVNHEIFIAKLHIYGIWGVSEDWSKSYLTNTRQKNWGKNHHATQNFFSVWITLKHGVSQGSIPGPELFMMCITDLPPRISSVSEPILFADDTSVIISSRNFQYLCLVSNLVLFRMIKWFFC